MQKQSLNAELRSTGRHPIRELRDASRVPAVVYGHGIAAQAVSLDSRALAAALHHAGGGVIEMQIAGFPPMYVLVREVQRHPTKHTVRHVDFQAVSMTEKVRLHVSVVQEGTAPVLSNPDMVLVRALDAIEIECLPADIPEHLVVSLAGLATVDDELLVKDLKPAPGVRILTEGDQVIFSVTASRAALVTEEEVTEEAPAAAEVEVVTKRKPKEEAED